MEQFTKIKKKKKNIGMKQHDEPDNINVRRNADRFLIIWNV